MLLHPLQDIAIGILTGKYCEKCKSRHSSFDKEEDDRFRKKKSSSQNSLQQRYEKGDPEVDLLGEPSGKFDYYVLYLKKIVQTWKPIPVEPSKPDTPPSPPKPKTVLATTCKADVPTSHPSVQSLPQICMMQQIGNSYQAQYPALREFPPMLEYMRDKYRYMP